MNEAEFLECRGAVMDYLTKYMSQPSKLPRLQLVWSVSRRTLSKAKPSTRVLLDLETIMEDEVDDLDASDDAGVFDSENDDCCEITGRLCVDVNNNSKSPLRGELAFLMHSSEEEEEEAEEA